MKKFIFLTVLLWTTSTNAAWFGHALVVAQNQGIWKALMVLVNDQKNQAIWTDLQKTGSKLGKKGIIIAQEAVNDLLGIKNLPLNQSPLFSKQEPIDHWFHVFEASEFVRAYELYKKKASSIIDIQWVDLNILFTATTLSNKIGTYPIDPLLINFLTQNKPAILNSLPSAPITTTPPTTGSTTTLGNSWPKPGDLNAIHFYTGGQPYYSFANTFEQGSYDPLLPQNFSNTFSVDIDGHTWKSTEHWFQANKFIDPWDAYINNPEMQTIKASQLQRQHYTAPKNWHGTAHDGLKYGVMLKGLRAKFSQHPNLKNLLLGTGNKIIVEDAGTTDPNWGAGGDYKGSNHLGQMLMHVRQEINDGKQYKLQLVDDPALYKGPSTKLATPSSTTTSTPPITTTSTIVSVAPGSTWPSNKMKKPHKSVYDPTAINFQSNGKPFFSFSNRFAEKSIDPELGKISPQDTIPHFKIEITYDWGNNIHTHHFPTVEHYLQSWKYSDFGNPFLIYEQYLKGTSAHNAEKTIDSFMDDINIPLDWDSQLKYEVMLTAIRAKFTQWPQLKKLLLSTGDRMIVKKSSSDTGWGAGKNFKDKNHLGQILMHVRKELRDKKAYVLKLVDSSALYTGPSTTIDLNAPDWYKAQLNDPLENLAAALKNIAQS